MNALSTLAILDIFGVDWPKFIAQLIVVFIVYSILKAKAFGPVIALLEERRRRIQEGENNLKKIESDLAGAQAKVSEILDEANQKAESLIAEAKSATAVATEKKRQEAIAEASQIISKAREATELERERVMSLLKNEFGRLVVDATGKVTGKVLDEQDKSRLNQEAAAQLSA